LETRRKVAVGYIYSHAAFAEYAKTAVERAGRLVVTPSRSYTDIFGRNAPR